MDFDHPTQLRSTTPQDAQLPVEDTIQTPFDSNEKPLTGLTVQEQSQASDDTAPSITDLEVASLDTDPQSSQKMNKILPIIAAGCITGLVVGLALFLVYLQKSQLPVRTTPSSQVSKTIP